MCTKELHTDRFTLFSPCCTYPYSIPSVMVEENIAALFRFCADLDRIWQVLVLGHPHHELLVIPPIPARSVRA